MVLTVSLTLRAPWAVRAGRRCKAKRQYLLTCKVSRYCLLALQTEVQHLDVKVMASCSHASHLGSSRRFVS